MNKQIIKKPVLTEKSMRFVSEGRYMFEVASEANKKEIAASVGQVFGVTVVSVTTSVRAGETRRLQKVRGTFRTPKRKFAVVRLQKGQKIAGFDKALEVEDATENV